MWRENPRHGRRAALPWQRFHRLRVLECRRDHLEHCLHNEVDPITSFIYAGGDICMWPGLHQIFLTKLYCWEAQMKIRNTQKCQARLSQVTNCLPRLSFSHFSPQRETPSNWHTADTKLVQLVLGKAWFFLEAEITPMLPGDSDWPSRVTLDIPVGTFPNQHGTYNGMQVQGN